MKKIIVAALVSLSVILFNPAPAQAAITVNPAYVFNSTTIQIYVMVRSQTTGLRSWKYIYPGHGSTIGAEGFEIPDNWRFYVHSRVSGNNWETACGRYYPTWGPSHFIPTTWGVPLTVLGFLGPPASGC